MEESQHCKGFGQEPVKSTLEGALIATLQGLGSAVIPFCPFYLGVSLLKPNIRRRGTPIIKGLLGNLEGALQGTLALLLVSITHEQVIWLASFYQRRILLGL